VKFEWDSAKAAVNQRRHGVSFEEAAERFQDLLAMVLDEPEHPERLILIGVSKRRRVIFAVFAERGPATIRNHQCPPGHIERTEEI
jgi:uncharacterized DUF497 family protein